MPNTILTIALNDTRLRLRRWSTGISLLAIIVMTWLVIPDPAGGMALISVENTRLLYTSQTIALGSVTFAALFIGLVGVYLTRGQSQREIYNGVGALLASLPVSTPVLVMGRWLGALIFLISLITTFLFTVLILHGVRGEAPLEIGIYISVCFGILLPICAFAASMSVLWDAIPWLHRRAGDVAYFLFWTLQLAVVGQFLDSPNVNEYWLLIDSHGLSIGWRLQQVFGEHISIGLSDFDTSKTPMLSTAPFWTLSLVKLRVMSFFVMCLPLIPALWLFHRFDPAKIRQQKGQRQKTWWRHLNILANPIARGAGKLLPHTASLPAPLRNVVAEMLLTIILHPILLVLLIAAWIVQGLAQPEAAAYLRIGVLACTVVLIADISSRHRETGTDKLRFAIGHLREAGIWIEWSAAFALALLFVLPTVAQFIGASPLQTAALLVATVALASAGTLLGHLTRSGKTFTISFLFLKYVVANAGVIALLDFAGVHGSITSSALLVHAIITLTLLLSVEGVRRWRLQHD